MKKNHVISAFFFLNQVMYMCTSFRVAKHAKLGKKGCVSSHVYKYWLDH